MRYTWQHAITRVVVCSSDISSYGGLIVDLTFLDPTTFIESVELLEIKFGFIDVVSSLDPVFTRCAYTEDRACVKLYSAKKVIPQ